MNRDYLSPNTPLLRSVAQAAVDFVIPRMGIDLPLGIDPFLLYKSRSPELSNLHLILLQVFNAGIEYVREGDINAARRLFSFPEVPEIGLGYTKKGKRGSGVGTFLTELIIETLADSKPLLQKGVRHIEEMQLYSAHIGPDRVSDIAANVLKEFLIGYTQRQCGMWNISLVSGVPVHHVLSRRDMEWHDGYFDLPVSPHDGMPILLVPRRVVRTLPWINYNDFLRMEFSSYLRAKRVRQRLSEKGDPTVQSGPLSKETVAQIARRDVERVERYVSAKEGAAAEAQPSLPYLAQNSLSSETIELQGRLEVIPTGKEYASSFQRIVLEILNFLFNPELIDGSMEVRTHDGTERRDIIFTNDSDRSFWAYLRQEHSSFLIMFEAKNTGSLENEHLNQTATYLGDRLGRVGFIVTRKPLQEPQLKKCFSVYNDSNPKKIILVLSDKDMVLMLQTKGSSGDPMKHIQKLYRDFRTSVQ